MGKDEVLKRIAVRCVKQGDCIVWQGAMAGNTPVLSVRNEQGVPRNLNIRKFMAELESDGQCDAGRTRSICGNPRCIAPDHIDCGTMRVAQKRNHFGATKNGMQLNKKVIKLAVAHTIAEIRAETGVSDAHISTILRSNTAMHPYFYQAVLKHCDVEKVLADDQSDIDIRETYRLSRFALDFIQRQTVYPMVDFDSYDAALNSCEVHGSHLVCVSMLHNREEVADELQRAVFGAYIGSQTCGYEGCVNPYCVE